MYINHYGQYFLVGIKLTIIFKSFILYVAWLQMHALEHSCDRSSCGNYSVFCAWTHMNITDNMDKIDIS